MVDGKSAADAAEVIEDGAELFKHLEDKELAYALAELMRDPAVGTKRIRRRLIEIVIGDE